MGITSVVTNTVIGATVAGTIALGVIGWNGGTDLQTGLQSGKNIAGLVQTLSDNATAMVNKFTTFKGDVQGQLNAKIDKINALNSAIADLQSQLTNAQATGSSNASALQSSLDQANANLTQANKDASDLKAQMAQLEAQAQTVASGSATASNMDTGLTLNQQTDTPATITPAPAPTTTSDVNTAPATTTPTTDTTTTTGTTAPATTTPATTDYSAQEQSIMNVEGSKGITGVTMDTTTIAMTGNTNLVNEAQTIGSAINATVNYDHTDNSTNTVYYTYTMNN